MSVTTYPGRLLGGRYVGIVYDSVAGTITVAGQSITIASLSAALQTQWSNAVASVPGLASASRPPFAGTNVDECVGAILDSLPATRAAVATALATFVAEPAVE